MEMITRPMKTAPESQSTTTFPTIIQGGMGVGISGWRLARSVASDGQIGVVSGTALDLMLARRLQLGDPTGDLRRALAAFPDPHVSQRILDRYFISGGKQADRPFKAKPIVSHQYNRHVEELLVVANFAEVFLAKEGQDGLIGINYLQKIQTPLLPALYGAILAGVDIVIVGAGIPLEIPGILKVLSNNERAEMKLHVRNISNGDLHHLSFDPLTVIGPEIASEMAPLRLPLFFPVVSSVTLASLLINKCEGPVDGLIIEGPSAGGHNAPPRGPGKRTQDGEPIYGPRDEIDMEAIRSLGRPFWVAGSYGSPERLEQALATGASGVQIGTLFALCRESGLRHDLKRDALKACLNGTVNVFTDPVASPTGFPFKILSLSGTLSEQRLYEQRRRNCDLGYLREAFERPDGKIGWRCPADDPDVYVRSGGSRDETIGRKCLCNGLMANIDLPQLRKHNGEELPLLTCGDDLSSVTQLAKSKSGFYSSVDVIDFMLGRTN